MAYHYIAGYGSYLKATKLAGPEPRTSPSRWPGMARELSTEQQKKVQFEEQVVQANQPGEQLMNGAGHEQQQPLVNGEKLRNGHDPAMNGEDRRGAVRGSSSPGVIHESSSQPMFNRSQSTYSHGHHQPRAATREQSLQNHHVQPRQQPSPSMAVSHLRRTRSDHVMSSRSRESSNSRADSPRRTGEDVYELLANMKKRITDNLLGLSSPFGKRRERRLSGRSDKDSSASPAKSSLGGGGDMNGESPDLEEYEFVESIELNHMDGFVVGGKKEPGRGHCFQPINLATPTWCDQCGDFIWGVYKQCLKCKCKYPLFFHGFVCIYFGYSYD